MWIPTPIGGLWLQVGPQGVRVLEPALFPRGPEAKGPLAAKVRQRVLAYFAGERPGFLDISLDYTGIPPTRVALYDTLLC